VENDEEGFYKAIMSLEETLSWCWGREKERLEIEINAKKNTIEIVIRTKIIFIFYW